MSAPEQITPISGIFQGIPCDLLFRYDDGSADVSCSGITSFIPREDMPPTFDAYAWPGGYPLAYYLLSGSGDLSGIVLCPGCAKTEYDAWEPDEWNPTPPRFHAEIKEEVHDTIVCDGCIQPFIYQTYCDFCQASVDVGEDTPHVCKPLKWTFTAAYRREQPYPTTERYATREAARENQRRYKRMGYWTSAVAPIVPPILPDAWS